jgi:hypothetical protein
VTGVVSDILPDGRRAPSAGRNVYYFLDCHRTELLTKTDAGGRYVLYPVPRSTGCVEVDLTLDEWESGTGFSVSKRITVQADMVLNIDRIPPSH